MPRDERRDRLLQDVALVQAQGQRVLAALDGDLVQRRLAGGGAALRLRLVGGDGGGPHALEDARQKLGLDVLLELELGGHLVDHLVHDVALAQHDAVLGLAVERHREVEDDGAVAELGAVGALLGDLLLHLLEEVRHEVLGDALLLGKLLDRLEQHVALVQAQVHHLAGLELHGHLEQELLGVRALRAVGVDGLGDGEQAARHLTLERREGLGGELVRNAELLRGVVQVVALVQGEVRARPVHVQRDLQNR